ncbi:hypothetical protein BJ875DRAFT_494695 [Amylocarpus encephaloides]|uniref:Uncharacterized protein n=1 Tax=Amylocarpus encephaloides TaxID=45428 RepID=A0A9P7YMQ0_9HELO|nr:hypothetical protein BJ875DRAFT_494695 [Amylocarpus encephaloides]
MNSLIVTSPLLFATGKLGENNRRDKFINQGEPSGENHNCGARQTSLVTSSESQRGKAPKDPFGLGGIQLRIAFLGSTRPLSDSMLATFQHHRPNRCVKTGRRMGEVISRIKDKKERVEEWKAVKDRKDLPALGAFDFGYLSDEACQFFSTIYPAHLAIGLYTDTLKPVVKNTNKEQTAEDEEIYDEACQRNSRELDAFDE